MLFAEVVQRRESGSVSLLRTMLNSRNRARVQMVLELMTTGSRATYGPLLQRVFRDAIKERQYITAGYCAEAVGTWRLDAGFPLLVSTLRNEKLPESLRLSCAQALAKFDRAEAVSALRRAARDPEGRNLAPQCLQLLVAMGDEGLKAVAGILKDGSTVEQRRIEAARALANATGPLAAPALLSILTAGGGRNTLKLRAEAAAALGPLAKDNAEAFKALVDMMKERNAKPLVRNACMHGVGLSGSVEAIPHLIDVMQNPDVDNHKYTRSTAYQFLVRISNQRRIGMNPKAWRVWWEENKEQILKEAGK